MSNIRVFDVAVGKIASAIKSVDRANRRLERAGITERFDIKVTEYDTMRVHPVTGYTFTAKRAKVTLTHPVISYGDYTFLARIEETEGNLLAFTAPGIELKGWRPETMQCEHCMKTRARTKVYVIENGAGERKVVGGSCVQLYTGLSPQGLWALEWDDVKDDDPEDDETFFTHAKPAFKTDKVLELAWSLVSSEGYKPTSFTDSTRDKIISIIHGGKFDGNIEVTASTIRGKVQGAYEVLMDDYSMNVMAYLNTEYIDSKGVGVLSSSLKSIIKREREEKAAEGIVNEFYAFKDDKIERVSCELVDVWSREEYFGYRSTVNYYMTFKTDSGHRLFWKTSRKDRPELNVKIHLTGVVSGLDDYKGVKSTRVKNVKWWLDSFSD